MRGRGRENKETEPSYLMFCLVSIFSPFFFFTAILSHRAIISSKLGGLLYVRIHMRLQPLLLSSHGSLNYSNKWPLPSGVDQTALCPPNCHSLRRCPVVLSSRTHTSAGEVIHGTLTKAARTSSV